MPLYSYACRDCSHADDEFQRMASEPLTTCPVCGKATYERQVSLPHTDLKEYAAPIEMYSVAVEELDEIRELQRKCPDADISTDPADEMYGVPIARSRKAKLQVLKATGHHENNSERVRV
jgi:putative FmdB family regulatory protein